MPPGEKSGNPRVKSHRAAGIARRMMREGVPRASANRIATGAMEREYARRASSRAERARTDENEHDSRSGERKTNLSVKHPAVSGARKPGTAQRASTSKRRQKATGGGDKATAARKPRGRGATKSASAVRPPIPR
jgi:hypothetical protein